MPKSSLSPRELALAIGASESSVKRWADDGHIAIAKTAGGHRRIPLADAVQFIRARRFTLARPEILGLGDLELTAAREATADPVALLRSFLVDGRGAEVRGLVLGWYFGGLSVATIGDERVGPALEAIGTLWLDSKDGIYIEHRATDLCLAALHQLRAVLPAHPDGPIAIGGGCAGDTSLLPTTFVALTLVEHGFRAQSLGADTPVETLIRAIEREHPALVWLSANHVDDPRAFERELAKLAAAIVHHDVTAVCGGRALAQVEVPIAPRLRVAKSLGELAAWVDGWRAR